MVADIRRVYGLPPDMGRLVALSEAEDFAMVARMVQRWSDGSNRFDKPGEALVEARSGGFLVGIGGINVDPYLDDPNVGRIRHLYVDPAFRGQSIARGIVERLVALSDGRFDRVRVRAGPPGAGAFYDAIGFEACDEPAATHQSVP